MRSWRKYVKAKLEQMEAEACDPSGADWAELGARVEAWHAAVAGGRC